MSTAEVETSRTEREMLRDALQILDPDSPEAAEDLEVFTQDVLRLTPEDEEGTEILQLDRNRLELAISALDIIDPVDDEAAELADGLAERLRHAHEGIEAGAPEI